MLYNVINEVIEVLVMNIYLARQAIYDRNFKVEAYELLFRNSKENRFVGNIDEDSATIKLISNCATIGLNELTNNKKAYINFSQGVLLNDVASLLSKEKVVVEILENVIPTEDVVSYLQELKSKGYILALDDVSFSTNYKNFGTMIDIYKIDFKITSPNQRKFLVNVLKNYNPGAKLLAEKIETDEEYIEAMESGYSYFQGYYFSKPLMIEGKDIPVRNVTCFNLMSELLRDDFDIDKIESIIKTDVSISYKLMKFLNSAAFSFVQKISSIKQAIMLLGRRELKKWLSMIVMSEMRGGNSEEVTNGTIIRGRFCELVQSRIEEKNQSLAFMVGLFSNLDSYMQKDMAEIIKELPVDEEIKDALLGKENNLRKVLELVLSYENMNINRMEEYCEMLNLDKKILIDLYMESIEWSNRLVII